jgi:glycosyltransferase involved in cell wall biosynthesis
LPHLDHGPVLYNRSDRHSEFGEADNAWLRGLEDSLLRRSDRVLYTSHALMDEERGVVGDRATWLDHGVDVAHFTVPPGAPVPPELAHLPRPIIGFFGAIEDYLVDLALLDAVAGAFPAASIVLVGPATCSLGAVGRRPNVDYLGVRPYEQIPLYGAAFDVALMPWLDNAWIRYANPIKLKEYLALGVPIVSTPFPELEHYGDAVRTASGTDAFIAAVGAALDERDPDQAARRRALVADATWDRVAQRMLDEIAACEESRAGSAVGR